MNPSSSPTDEMVNHAEAEKAMKSERRNQWQHEPNFSITIFLNLGQIFLITLEMKLTAQEILTGALGGQKDAPNDAFLRRMCEVAVRRVARKRRCRRDPASEVKMTFLRLILHSLMTGEY